MSKVAIKTEILRYNPSVDKKPYWKEYTLEIEQGVTILDVLNEIHWHMDGTLTFRRSCRSAICGSCAMKVNGCNVLACETPLHMFIGKTIKIEPLPGFSVVRDLVVDMDSFFEKIQIVKPFLVLKKSTPAKEFVQTPEEFELIREAANCILCGACTSSCPSLWANDGYIGPAALLKAARFVYDSRDDACSERLEIVNCKNGLWRCHTIFNCVEACPKHIKITDYLSKLKVSALSGKV